MKTSILFSDSTHLNTAETIIEKYATSDIQTCVDGSCIVLSADINDQETDNFKDLVNHTNQKIGGQFDTFVASISNPISKPN